MVIQEEVSTFKTLLLVSGVGDRDDHQAGGEEQEEGSPVLA